MHWTHELSWTVGCMRISNIKTSAVIRCDLKRIPPIGIIPKSYMWIPSVMRSSADPFDTERARTYEWASQISNLLERWTCSDRRVKLFPALSKRYTQECIRLRVYKPTYSVVGLCISRRSRLRLWAPRGLHGSRYHC